MPNLCAVGVEPLARWPEYAYDLVKWASSPDLAYRWWWRDGWTCLLWKRNLATLDIAQQVNSTTNSRRYCHSLRLLTDLWEIKGNVFKCTKPSHCRRNQPVLFESAAIHSLLIKYSADLSFSPRSFQYWPETEKRAWFPRWDKRFQTNRRSGINSFRCTGRRTWIGVRGWEGWLYEDPDSPQLWLPAEAQDPAKNQHGSEEVVDRQTELYRY